MAHFAKLDSNNIVTQILVVSNDILLDSDGNEDENLGITFLNNTFGSANWKQTSFNNNFRKQYAGINYQYDATNNVFIKPQPYNSWSLDSNFDWQAPVAYPNDNKNYSWNEDKQTWDEFIPPQPFDSWTWNETEWQWEAPTPRPDDCDSCGYLWNEDEQTWETITE